MNERYEDSCLTIPFYGRGDCPTCDAAFGWLSPGSVVAHVSDPATRFGMVQSSDEQGATVVEFDGDIAWFDVADIRPVAAVSLVKRPAPVERDTLAIDTAAREAGLEVMGMAGVLGIVWNRDTVPAAALAALTPEQVTDLFDSFIAPAIDRLESALADRSHT